MIVADAVVKGTFSTFFEFSQISTTGGQSLNNTEGGGSAPQFESAIIAAR